MRIAMIAMLAMVLLPLLLMKPSRGEDAGATTQAYDWKQLDNIIGAKGILRDDVYRFELPRTDLNVSIDAMEVPTAAGICSQFYFYKCSCGKVKVVGHFCCADYEANDVVDAIRPGAMLEVSSLSPMFSGDKPRLTVVRFQGEGDATAMAQLIKSGLGWMGEARSATRPSGAGAMPAMTTQPSR